MIVEFSVKNFRSIKDLQTISFVATGLKSADRYAAIDENNIVEQDGMKLFKTLGIYGANASGKSNVLKALHLFIEAINREPSSKTDIRFLSQPFYYQDDQFLESFFQIVFFVDGMKYRYGFTVKKNDKKQNGNIDYSKYIISNEWLYGKKDKNMRLLFERSANNLENKLPNKEKTPTSIPYEFNLFISHAAAFDSEGICKKIKEYFIYSNSNSIWKDENFRDFSILSIKEDKQRFLKLLSVFNMEYEDILIEEKSQTDRIHPREKIFLVKENRYFNLEFHESAGTQKLFNLAGVLLFCFNAKYNQYGSIIQLDEIDSNFHPSLLIKLVSLFNDSKMNKTNAQLLFTSHDTNLMSPSIMRRDQFYFTEKNEDHSTRLYSLADLKGIRNNADFARQYLAGYYGAVPVLKDYVAPEIVEND